MEEWAKNLIIVTIEGVSDGWLKGVGNVSLMN